jgi:hypothetical protein
MALSVVTDEMTWRAFCSRSHGVCNDENNYEYIFYTDVNGNGNIDICNRADLGVRCHDSTTLSNKLKVITNSVLDGNVWVISLLRTFGVNR